MSTPGHPIPGFWESVAHKLSERLIERDKLLERSMGFAQSVLTDMEHSRHMQSCRCSECAIYSDALAIIAEVEAALGKGWKCSLK